MTTLPERPDGEMTPDERAKRIGLALCNPIDPSYPQEPELQEGDQADLDMIAAEIRAACAHTLERCAKVADKQEEESDRANQPYDDGAGSLGYELGCRDCAAAIPTAKFVTK